VDPARLRAVEDIFHAAVGAEPPQLEHLLRERCAGDESLRREVEALLAGHRCAGGFIETPIATLDERLFEDEEADRLVGHTIGHWEILRRIGSGGMGAVYLARRGDRQYEQQVAIKLIKRGMDTEAMLRRFRNERQILAGFDHPNIARLLDGDTTDTGLPYFVMEYVEGIPVDEYCNRYGLAITARLQLFRQVCAAVSYAHRRAVIHRDLKPSNILVSADGVPKLLDFGIARLVQPAGMPDAAVSMVELRVMTPEYASPEQVRGEPVTTASDVYSLGMILYRLLTGRLPYRLPSTSSLDLARTIAESVPERPSTVAAARGAGAAGGTTRARALPEGSPERLRRRLRGDLDNIVLMALRKEPERRYPTVEQLSEDIRRHLESLPVLARRDTPGYRVGKFVRRHTAATAAGLLVVLSLLGGIVATSWQAHRAHTQEAIAKAEKARAERRFNEVRQLARSVLFDYHDAIKDLPGATAVRERLVRDGLAYLDSLSREAGGEPDLQRELAAAYDRVGDVRGQAYSAASLGDRAGAQESYLKALRIRETLVAASPGDVQGRRDLARSYVKIGRQMLDTIEAARGMEYLRKGLALQLGLAADQPANLEFRQDLAATYNMLGLAAEDRGDAAGALENHRQALVLREALVAAEPGNPDYRRGLALTDINLGRALVLSGDTKGGAESNRKALAICEALLADYPDNVDYRRLLNNTYQNDGDYRANLQDVTGALQSFRKKLEVDEQLLADDPVNAIARGGLAYSHHRIGALLAESGDPRQALLHHRQGLAIFDELRAASPEDLYLRFAAILSRASVAEMHARLGDRASALADSSRAIALLDETAEDPTRGAVSSLRGQVYMRVAASYTALAASGSVNAAEQHAHWRAACDMYARSRGIWQDMQKRGILTAQDAANQEEVARAIAQCDRISDARQRAIEPLEQHPRIVRREHERRPDLHHVVVRACARHEDAVLAQQVHDPVGLGGGLCARRVIAHDLEPPEQPAAAHVRDERVLGRELREPGRQHLA
jgi:non-specific serine/threonine protein kinase/serine/threonine-protein kinase